MWVCFSLTLCFVIVIPVSGCVLSLCLVFLFVFFCLCNSCEYVCVFLFSFFEFLVFLLFLFCISVC